MLLLPPRSKPSATLVPVTTLFRSKREQPPIGEIFGISRGVEGRRVRRTVAGGGGKREEQDRSGAPQAAERIRFAQRRRGAEAEETRDGAQTGWQRWPPTGPLCTSASLRESLSPIVHRNLALVISAGRAISGSGDRKSTRLNSS